MGYTDDSIEQQTEYYKLKTEKYESDKEQWILSQGSDLLKSLFLHEYRVEKQYLEERLSIEFPDFHGTAFYCDWSNPDNSFRKADSPPEFYFNTCLAIDNSYCTEYSDDYYITIDNYLGKHKIVSKIKPPINTSTSLSIKESNLYELEKKDWIFLYGSDLLQRSIVLSFDANERYLQERLQIEYPGFSEIDPINLSKIDSPSEDQLKACILFDNSYCAQNIYDHRHDYVAIDNYLSKYTIGKKIDINLARAKNKSIVKQSKQKANLSTVVISYTIVFVSLAATYGFTWSAFCFLFPPVGQSSETIEVPNPKIDSVDLLLIPR
jgi:hypothetical protein